MIYILVPARVSNEIISQTRLEKGSQILYNFLWNLKNGIFRTIRLYTGIILSLMKICTLKAYNDFKLSLGNKGNHQEIQRNAHYKINSKNDKSQKQDQSIFLLSFNDKFR